MSTNWNDVFDKNNPKGIFLREFTTGCDDVEGSRKFTSEEKNASHMWNSCAVGGSSPKLGLNWTNQYDLNVNIIHPSKESQALEFFGIAFMNAVEQDDIYTAFNLWNEIKLLAPKVKTISLREVKRQINLKKKKV